MKNSISKIFKRTSQTILYLVIVSMLLNCAKKVIPKLQQTDRLIEGQIIDNSGFEISDADVYLYGTDITTTTDGKGYFKLILPKEYEISDTYYIEILLNENGYKLFEFNVYENKMNDLKLEYFDLNLINSIMGQNKPSLIGTTIPEELLLNAYKIKFQVVYKYSFDASFELDKSWFEDNGKPVPNAIIKIVGTENIYTSNENGEIWIDKNEIKIGDVLIVEEEMGTQSQVYISDEILNDGVIPLGVLVNID